VGGTCVDENAHTLSKYNAYQEHGVPNMHTWVLGAYHHHEVDIEIVVVLVFDECDVEWVLALVVAGEELFTIEIRQCTIIFDVGCLKGWGGVAGGDADDNARVGGVASVDVPSRKRTSC
jgi:hypothetical protein